MMAMALCICAMSRHCFSLGRRLGSSILEIGRASCGKECVSFGVEERAGVVGIRFHGEGGERHHVDAVALLERLRVGVAEGEAEHAGYTSLVAGGRAHPENVVVAPLDVPVVVGRERVHDEVSARSAVEDVAEDMELVDGEALDEFAERHDEACGAPRADDGLDNHAHVSLLVAVVAVLVEEFFDDVGKLLRQTFAHFRTGVFRGNAAADGDELVERSLVIVGEVRVLLLHQFEFLFRVVDECAEVADFLLSQRVSEDFLHLSFNVARCVSEHVVEGFVLAVEVGEEVFRRFRKVQDGFEVDDFRSHLRDGGKVPRQQFEVSEVSADVSRRKVVFGHSFKF